MSKLIKYPKLALYSVGVLFVWTLVYNFTWANTWNLNTQVTNIQQELIDFEQNKLKIEDPSQLDILKVSINDSLDFQHEILAIISKTLNNKKAVIHQFSELQKVKSEELEVQIQPVILQGEFFGLLSTLNDLEQNYQALNIASVNLYVEKNRKNKRNELFLKIYVQKLI